MIDTTLYTTKILHSPFDIETHKKAFVNYLEIIIREDGTVEYAVPSHSEKLIRIAMEKMGISRKELYALCPIEYCCDVCKWLCSITGCIAVWTNCYTGSPNPAQQKTLKLLTQNHLYTGIL